MFNVQGITVLLEYYFINWKLKIANHKKSSLQKKNDNDHPAKIMNSKTLIETIKKGLLLLKAYSCHSMFVFYTETLPNTERFDSSKRL